jgi:hypothetical protein
LKAADKALDGVRELSLEIRKGRTVRAVTCTNQEVRPGDSLKNVQTNELPKPTLQAIAFYASLPVFRNYEPNTRM